MGQVILRTRQQYGEIPETKQSNTYKYIQIQIQVGEVDAAVVQRNDRVKRELSRAEAAVHCQTYTERGGGDL